MSQTPSRREFLGSAAVAVAGAGSLAAQKPKRPNILFTIHDDWSHGHAGAYGCTWVKTPVFDRVARDDLRAVLEK